MDKSEQIEYLGLAAALGRLTMVLKSVEQERDQLRARLEEASKEEP